MLNDDQTINVILSQIRTEMNTVADVILTTHLPMEDYRRLQGQIEGFAVIEAKIKEMVQAAEDAEHELD